MLNKILADHDDVYSHGTILYTDDWSWAYADKQCTETVHGETLIDTFLKGCVLALVDPYGEIMEYRKPTSLKRVSEDIYEGGYMLECAPTPLYIRSGHLRLEHNDGRYADIDIEFVTTNGNPDVSIWYILFRTHYKICRPSYMHPQPTNGDDSATRLRIVDVNYAPKVNGIRGECITILYADAPSEDDYSDAFSLLNGDTITWEESPITML